MKKRQRGAGTRKTRHSNKLDTCEWMTDAQSDFDDLKGILSACAGARNPCEAEPMLLYITTTNQVFSTVLVIEREEEGKVHGF
jgi:hypothetical protein